MAYLRSNHFVFPTETELSMRGSPLFLFSWLLSRLLLIILQVIVLGFLGYKLLNWKKGNFEEAGGVVLIDDDNTKDDDNKRNNKSISNYSVLLFFGYNDIL
jgi:hypothetical protein